MGYGDNQPAPPQCPSCGAGLKCPGCDDIRPTAEDLHTGWQFRSPVDRWETVERTDSTGYGPVRIWTKETGPDYCWLLWRHTKLEATRPPLHLHGTPEIRIVEYEWRDGPMYAVATISTHRQPDTFNALVEARHGGRGKGWIVTHRPNGNGDPVVIECASKAAARTSLRAAAKLHAKALGVKLVTQPRS